MERGLGGGWKKVTKKVPKGERKKRGKNEVRILSNKQDLERGNFRWGGGVCGAVRYHGTKGKGSPEKKK